MDENLIKSAIEEWMNFDNWSTSDKELWKLAVELWKIEKKFQKCNEKLSEEENKSFEFLFNRVNQIFENNKVKITEFTNEKWNEWMALLDIIAVEERDWLEFPIIWETISPLIEVNWNIVQRSKVVIYKPKAKEAINLIPKKKILWLWLPILLLIILLIVWIFLLFHNNSNNEQNINTEDQTNIEAIWTIEEHDKQLNENNNAELVNEENKQEILEDSTIESTESNEEITEENI